MKSSMLSIGQIAKRIGIKKHVIEYALASGRLDEPERFLNRRCFNEQEFRRIKKYYGVQEIDEEGGDIV